MNIVYIGNVGVPNTAMALRAANISKVFEKNGHNVIFISYALDRNQIQINDAKYIYPKKRFKVPILRGIEWACETMTNRQIFTLLKKYNKETKIDSLIFYGGSCCNKIIKYCRKKGINIFLDAVDWFETDDCPSLILKLICIKNSRSMSILSQKLDGIIAISKYLYNYYTGKKLNCIWIPPLIDIEKGKQICRTQYGDEKIRLIYAGSCGLKDIISPIVDAVRIINERNKSILIRFDIIGVTTKELNELMGKNNWEYCGIFVHGKLSHDKTVEFVEKSDFSVLLRHNKRYAKAGFSTKFAESMANGVPVICTAVGGADSVITDGVNGFCIEDNSVESVANKLEYIMSLSDNTILEIKKHAYIKARELFASENYTKQLVDFVTGNIFSHC